MNVAYGFILLNFLFQPLDRDPPDGFEIWQILIAASDEGGNGSSLRTTTEVVITLTDINDNAPYLDMVNILNSSLFSD